MTVIDVDKPTRNLAPLARKAIIALWAWIATDVLLALASLQQIGVLGGFGGEIADPAALSSSDDLNAVAGMIYFVGYAVAGIFVLRWIFVANRNVRALGGTTSVSPRWNVIWFFVPIANLWKPFSGVRQTWQATLNPADPKSVPVPPIMRAWWTLWLITTTASNLTARLYFGADTPEEAIGVNWLYVLTLIPDIACTIALVSVMRQLTAHQSAALDAGAQQQPGIYDTEGARDGEGGESDRG